MTQLVEWLVAGGGLEGASPKQVKAILAKLETMAVVIEHRSLPQAVFGVVDGEPYVAYWNATGAMNTTAAFARDHLSPARAKRAVREAMAIHAAVSSTDPLRADGYNTAREAYVRRLLEAKSVDDGGAPSLAEGAL